MSKRAFAPARDRMAAVILRRRGKSFRQIARLLRRSASFVKIWNDRFKAGGATALFATVNVIRRSKLNDHQRSAVRQRILAGPTATDQVAVFTIADIQRIIQIEHQVQLSRSAISRLLRRLGIVRLRPRPRHEKQNSALAATWRQSTWPSILGEIKAAHATQSVEVWFQDETRFGQKTRSAKIWAERGSRPFFVDQNGSDSAYIFGAVNPTSGARIGLVATHCDSDVMQLHLDEIGRSVAIGTHIALVLDGAGWHHAKALRSPSNITLCHLPPYSPELNPIERLWLWIKQKHLSFRLYRDTEAIIAAGVAAWNMVTDADVMSVCRVGAAPAR